MRKTVQKSIQSPTTSDVVKDAIPADSDSARELMQAVLAKPRNTETIEVSKDKPITGVVIGTLSEPSKDGQPMVFYPGIPTGKPLIATSTTDLGSQKSGQEVALGFVNGDPAMPVILGFIQKASQLEQTAVQEAEENRKVNVKIDGERLILSAEHEIVLECGKSSITLTKAGKVILKGAYLSTHATGVNRIKGGSVQIN